MIPKIVLDFETSGLNPYHDDIIEVAMKNIDTDDEYVSLLKPKSNECISPEITALTGITNRMLAKEGKSWEEVYKFMNEWLLSMLKGNDSISIISHNGESFDFIFLRRVLSDLRDLGIKTIPVHRIIFIDTLLISKRLLPRRVSYKQSSLCSHYNITTTGSHRALNDIIALKNLYKTFTEILNKSQDKRKCFYDNPHMIENYIKLKYIL